MHGELTCTANDVKSVVDYFIASTVLFQYVKSISVQNEEFWTISHLYVLLILTKKCYDCNATSSQKSSLRGHTFYK